MTKLCGRDLGKLYTLKGHIAMTKRCGKKYGKPYASKRHRTMAKQCIKLEQFNPGLAEAIVRLQKAKKEEIYPAIKLCLGYYSKYS